MHSDVSYTLFPLLRELSGTAFALQAEVRRAQMRKIVKKDAWIKTFPI